MNELTTETSASPGLAIFNPSQMNALVQFSEMMAKSVISVPDHLRGKPADCMAIAMQAAQWGMNPFAVAQKTHVVSGRLGYEAQLVNAVVQQSGAIVGSFSYEYRGDNQAVECRVGAVLRGEAEITWGEWLSANSVQTKNSPLWKTNPKQQLGYLQVKNWARAYAPGAILGVYTPDELDDIPAGPRHMGMADEVPVGPRRKSETQAEAAPAPAAQAGTVINAETGEVEPPAQPEPAQRQAPKPAAAPAAEGTITSGQTAWLRAKLKAVGLDESSVCDRFQITGIEMLGAAQFDGLKSELIKMA